MRRFSGSEDGGPGGYSTERLPASGIAGANAAGEWLEITTAGATISLTVILKTAGACN